MLILKLLNHYNIKKYIIIIQILYFYHYVILDFFFFITTLLQKKMVRKNTEFNLAYRYYVEDGLTAKRISEKLNISEKTISNWINKFNWKEQRVAKFSNPNSLLEKLELLLATLIEKRIEQESSGNIDKNLINEIANIGKRIDKLREDSKPSLRSYLHSIDLFLANLEKFDSQLYAKVLDFYRFHLQNLKEL